MPNIRNLALASLLLLAPLTAALAAPVELDSGAVEGVRERSLVVYRGIPYAAAPIGASRWREPQPVASWTGVRMANAFAPACMQTGVSMPGETPPKTSEDC